MSSHSVIIDWNRNSFRYKNSCYFVVEFMGLLSNCCSFISFQKLPTKIIFLQNQADCSNFLMNVVRYMLLLQIQSEGNFNDNVSKCIFLAYEHGTLRDNLKKKKRFKPNCPVQSAWISIVYKGNHRAELYLLKSWLPLSRKTGCCEGTTLRR